MKTAIYSRVSTEKQSTDSQMKELTAYSKGKDCVWFSDKFTGRKMNRPGMDKLLDAVRRGEVNRIVVYDLSRLGRTAKGLTALFEELIERKCTLVSLKDGIDLLTPSGRLIANVLASVAQFETEMRREKVIAGIEAKRKRGEKWNNGRPVGTVKWTKQDVEAIKSMKASGLPVAKIVSRVKLSRSTIYSILSGV